MSRRTLTVELLLGVLSFGSGAAMADGQANSAGPSGWQTNNTIQNTSGANVNHGGGMRPGNGGGNSPGWNNNGRGRNNNNFVYLPWVSGGFGPYYPADSTGPQQSQQQTPQVYDIAPAVGEASYADAEFDNRWASLQVLVDRSRREFEISDDYRAAQKNLDSSQRTYDAAVETVMDRLLDDPTYKDLVQKRTEEQIALKGTGVGSGLRNTVATQKLTYGSQVSAMEAQAMTNDPAVQDARTKLVSADDNLRLKEKRFEADLYKRPDVVAARQQMETARANKAGADGYLYGANITRVDQLNTTYQSNSGNNVFYSPYDWRGNYGLGIGDF